MDSRNLRPSRSLVKFPRMVFYFVLLEGSLSSRVRTPGLGSFVVVALQPLPGSVESGNLIGLTLACNALNPGIEINPTSNDSLLLILGC